MSFSYLVRVLLNFIKATLLELWSLILVILTIPLDLTRPITPKRLKHTTPILLVHGFMHNSSAWVYLRHRLKESGFGPIYAINLGSPYHSIEDYARMVQQKAKLIARQTGTNEIILIGHSMGGLVCHYYTAYLASEDTVKAIITLGSPLEGTKMAVLAVGQCGKEMLYQSPFIQELHAKIAEKPFVPTFHFGTKMDFIIQPASSSLSKIGKATCIEFDSIGHLSFLYYPAVGDKIIECMRRMK